MTDDQPTAGVALKPDEGGCVTKRFVLFTTPGRSPQKKGGWLKREHLIDFLREVILHDGWKPGFRVTVLELTWDNDLWEEEGCAYLWEHDTAIGPRRARKAWKEAREKHERLYKTAPKAKLGDEVATFRKLTALRTPASGAVEAARKGLQSILDDFDRENADDIDNDDFNVGQDEHIEVPTASLRRVLAALTSEPKAEGEAKPKGPPQLAMAWLNRGTYPASLVDDLNGFITGGSGRCLEALEALGVNVMHRVDEAAPQPLQGGEVTREAKGIYVASRASVPERSVMWRYLRAEGHPIISSWIDEAGEGESHDLVDLWSRILREVTSASRLVLYATGSDFPLKGALIEVGMALAAGVPVFVVLDGVDLEPRSLRPLGSWAKHPLVTFCPSVSDALISPAQREGQG